MTYNPVIILAAANFFVCIGIAWACICRLNSPVSRKYWRVRARYSILLGAAMAYGMQPTLFGEYPTVAGTMLSAAILAGLILNVNRWKLFDGSEKLDAQPKT